MKRYVAAIIIAAGLLLFGSRFSPVRAALSFGGGYYTNLCGSGQDATADTCNSGCDPTQGTCTSDKAYVVKFTCQGRQTSCRNSPTQFATSQKLLGASCGTTVEIDVYKKTCQTLFGWFCNDSDRTDFMTWYTGDCSSQSGTPSITPTPAQSVSTCSSLTVTAGNNSRVPASVTFDARGTDTAGPISDYLYYFGDGQQLESPGGQTTHQYQTSGMFTSRVFVKDALGNWKTSDACQTSVTVTGTALESQKSACSNLFILSGNYTQAPSQVQFQVTGYDNKGGIKGYRLDPGYGSPIESQSDRFTVSYPTAGTYTVRGFIQDSQNTWTGGTDTCVRTLYISTQPLTSQPGTGTPTLYTVIALASGVIGISLLFSSRLATVKSTRSHRKRR